MYRIRWQTVRPAHDCLRRALQAPESMVSVLSGAGVGYIETTPGQPLDLFPPSSATTTPINSSNFLFHFLGIHQSFRANSYNNNRHLQQQLPARLQSSTPDSHCLLLSIFDLGSSLSYFLYFSSITRKTIQWVVEATTKRPFSYIQRFQARNIIATKSARRKGNNSKLFNDIFLST